MLFIPERQLLPYPWIVCVIQLGPVSFFWGLVSVTNCIIMAYKYVISQSIEIFSICLILEKNTSQVYETWEERFPWKIQVDLLESQKTFRRQLKKNLWEACWMVIKQNAMLLVEEGATSPGVQVAKACKSGGERHIPESLNQSCGCLDFRSHPKFGFEFTKSMREWVSTKWQIVAAIGELWILISHWV